MHLEGSLAQRPWRSGSTPKRQRESAEISAAWSQRPFRRSTTTRLPSPETQTLALKAAAESSGVAAVRDAAAFGSDWSPRNRQRRSLAGAVMVADLFLVWRLGRISTRSVSQLSTASRQGWPGGVPRPAHFWSLFSSSRRLISVPGDGPSDWSILKRSWRSVFWSRRSARSSEARWPSRTVASSN